MTNLMTYVKLKVMGTNGEKEYKTFKIFDLLRDC